MIISGVTEVLSQVVNLDKRAQCLLCEVH